MSGTERFFRRRSLLRAQSVRYGDLEGSAELDPFRVIWVNPDQIRFEPQNKPSFYPKEDREVTHVIAGSWDLEPVDFWSSPLASALRDRFLLQAPWEETGFVQQLIMRLNRGEPGPFWHKCRSLDDIVARCAKVDALYRSIANDGYRTPRGVSWGVSGVAKEFPPSAISVAVDRVGNFLHLNGRHRLAICKVLQVELIPVRVGVRHRDWQTLRRDWTMGTPQRLSDRLLQHPDLTYLTRRSL